MRLVRRWAHPSVIGKLETVGGRALVGRFLTIIHPHHAKVVFWAIRSPTTCTHDFPTPTRDHPAAVRTGRPTLDEGVRLTQLSSQSGGGQNSINIAVQEDVNRKHEWSVQ